MRVHDGFYIAVLGLAQLAWLAALVYGLTRLVP
jgi:hypothetical protein